MSELSWLQMTHTHVGPRQGWLHVGHNGSKEREIDLLNEARKPLCTYLQNVEDKARTYVFASQRSERLTEEGIYYWFRTLKAQGTRDQWESIEDLTFNDLRHDFAQRARGAGWSLGEVAYYFGDVTEKSTRALQGAVLSTQTTRERLKHKLNNVEG